MSDGDSTIFKQLKKPLYGFVLGIGAAFGGERFISYMRKKYSEHRENELEEFAEKVVKKYKEATEQG